VSFRVDAKHRTWNLEIPGLVLAHHPGMTVFDCSARHRELWALAYTLQYHPQVMP